MNLKEMAEQCAMLLDMDGQLSGEISAFTAEQQALYNRLVAGINTSYLTVARDLWRPIQPEDVTTDSQGRVAVASLQKQFLSLFRAEKDGRKTIAKEYKDYIHIFGLPGTAIKLYYYYLPEALAAETDIPILPESAVDPMAYVYFAVSLYYTVEKRHSEAAAWDLRYRNIVDHISEGRGAPSIKGRRWC